MPKKVFGAKRDEVAREWRGLCNKKLHDSYCLPDIIQVVKSKRMIWVGHVVFRWEVVRVT